MTELRFKRKVKFTYGTLRANRSSDFGGIRSHSWHESSLFFIASVLTRQMSAAEYGCELGRTGTGIVAVLDAAHHTLRAYGFGLSLGLMRPGGGRLLEADC